MEAGRLALARLWAPSPEPLPDSAFVAVGTLAVVQMVSLVLIIATDTFMERWFELVSLSCGIVGVALMTYAGIRLMRWMRL